MARDFTSLVGDINNIYARGRDGYPDVRRVYVLGADANFSQMKNVYASSLENENTNLIYDEKLRQIRPTIYDSMVSAINKAPILRRNRDEEAPTLTFEEF